VKKGYGDEKLEPEEDDGMRGNEFLDLELWKSHFNFFYGFG